MLARSFALLTFILLSATLPLQAPITTTPLYLPIMMGGPMGNDTQPPPTPPTTGPIPEAQRLVMRREVIRLVNEYRVANGCPAATENIALMGGAQAWSDYMQNMSPYPYVQHSSTVDYNWYKNHGYTLAGVTENIGAGQSTPQEIVNDWRASPNHNRTLLRCPNASLGYVYDVGVGLNGRLWTFALSEHLP